MNDTLSLPSTAPTNGEQFDDGPLEILLARDDCEANSTALRNPLPGQLPGAVVGTIAEIGDDSQPLVRLADDAPHIRRPARSTVPIDRAHIGAAVVLLFENANRRKPIIVGVLTPASPPAPAKTPFKVAVDDETVELSAEREIVLRCGKASITLTRAGKVLIRGAYVLSRSSGANRIKGGSVQIN